MKKYEKPIADAMKFDVNEDLMDEQLNPIDGTVSVVPNPFDD